MKFLAYAILFTVSVGGCNAQPNPDSSSTAPAEAGDSKARTSDDPKWMIAIEGMPEKSGNIITAVTMEGYGNYALGRSGFTASIKLNKDEPVSNIMIKFSDENIRCVSTDGATAIREGDRAVVAGEVLCYPADGSFDDAEPAAIEGYFEVKR